MNKICIWLTYFSKFEIFKDCIFISGGQWCICGMVRNMPNILKILYLLLLLLLLFLNWHDLCKLKIAPLDWIVLLRRLWIYLYLTYFSKFEIFKDYAFSFQADSDVYACTVNNEIMRSHNAAGRINNPSELVRLEHFVEKYT